LAHAAIEEPIMTVPTNPTILLPLDGSALAERATWLAAEIADRMHGRVLLLSVPEVYGLDPAWYSGATVDAGAPMIPVDELMAEARGTCEKYVAEAAGKLEDRGVSVDTIVAEDAPGRAIVAAAEETDAWLIVMATHGWGGMTRWALGSVADKVLRTANTPVAVVRSDAEHIDPKLDQLMVALDGSREAEASLARMRAMAQALDSRLTLVHVIVEPTIAFESAALLEAEAQHYARMEQYFTGLVEQLREYGVESDFELLVGQDAATALLDREARDDVDLLAITTHGHGGISRLAFGSVADRVLRSANTPVLVHRIDEEE
jgi:nucleotide-binding universal stress UspA family protein